MWGKNADPLTNVESAIAEGSWERLVRTEKQPQSSEPYTFPKGVLRITT